MMRVSSTFLGYLLLALIFSFVLYGQNSPKSAEPGPPGPDALPFLTDLFSRYGQAKTYRLEYTEERFMQSQYDRDWTQSVNTAILGPANHYRFERRGYMGDALQVSDGQTEWLYSPALNQYTEQPTPSDGPSRIRTAAALSFQVLPELEHSVKSISHFGKEIQSAKFESDQDLQIGADTIPCIVVATQGRLPVSGTEVANAFTFWIDKKSGLIRKYTSRLEGNLVPSDPTRQYVSEHTVVYSVAELNGASFPPDAFSFVPPASSVLVKQFESKQIQELAKLVGKPLPSVVLKSSDGREVPLQSFQGKPLLLDFWATWCVPCRESLPNLKKLYEENKEKGLVLLSVDQDEEQQKAVDFWAEQKMPWPNYHIDQKSLDKFPPHGIPYFLLVDQSGIILLSHDGLDEEKLRAALASLDNSSPKPK
jgi:thiol-disulfide isomerase/thioredoxin